MSLVGKCPGTYPAYANGCNFCANTLTYTKSGNGFVQLAYFLTNLKYANKLPKLVSRGYIHTCLLCVALNVGKPAISRVYLIELEFGVKNNDQNVPKFPYLKPWK